MASLKRWLLAVLYFPLTRMLIAIFIIVASLVLVGLILGGIGDSLGIRDAAWFDALRGVIVATTACLAYRGYVRLLEHRPVTELCRKGAVAELAVGIAIGFGILSATIACLWLGGFYHVEGFGTFPSVRTFFGVGVIAGFTEEIIFRGVIFRITEDSLGTWIATLITALLFGLVHLMNPNATWTAALSIAVEAGGLLAAAYVTTRRLWMPIGLHFAWNYSQGGIFGVAVSGQPVNGLIKSTLTGPELLSGGAFGAEASIFAVLIGTTMTIILLAVAIRRGHIVAPFWSRKRMEPTVEFARESGGENPPADSESLASLESANDSEIIDYGTLDVSAQ